jgi:hypothetical protein
METTDPMTASEERPVGRHVMLMGTCLCDAFYDGAAKATVEVLEHLGVRVDFPENQTCCGQPAFNSGDWIASRKVARHTAEVFDGDLPVIVPSGSCAAMNFHGNLLQFEEAPDEKVTSLAKRTWEVMDFIHNGLGIAEWEGLSKNQRRSHSTAPATRVARIAVRPPFRCSDPSATRRSFSSGRESSAAGLVAHFPSPSLISPGAWAP